MAVRLTCRFHFPAQPHGRPSAPPEFRSGKCPFCGFPAAGCHRTKPSSRQASSPSGSELIPRPDIGFHAGFAGKLSHGLFSRFPIEKGAGSHQIPGHIVGTGQGQNPGVIPESLSLVNWFGHFPEPGRPGLDFVFRIRAFLLRCPVYRGRTQFFQLFPGIRCFRVHCHRFFIRRPGRLRVPLFQVNVSFQAMCQIEIRGQRQGFSDIFEALFIFLELGPTDGPVEIDIVAVRKRAISWS